MKSNDIIFSASPKSSRNKRPEDIIFDPVHSPEQIKEMVIMTRLYLYNHNFYCGAKFIREELDAQDIRPLPSLKLINKILKENFLTHRRTGFYDQ